MARLDIQETTQTRSGNIVDWLPAPERTAPPPPRRPARPLAEGEEYAKTELQAQPEARGPEGTVAKIRFDVEEYLRGIGDKVPSDPEEVFSTLPPPTESVENPRYYARWRTQFTDSSPNGYWGAWGFINIWDTPDRASGDHTLSQLSIARGNGIPQQTIEVGKIETWWNGGAPSLFTYFTTNNYQGLGGDWIGGYNDFVLGYDPEPGMPTPGDAIDSDYYSVTNGPQYVMDVSIELWPSGNWWVWFNGEYIGHYPVCRNGVAPPCPANNTFIFSADGLRPRASRASFFGEVYDDNTPFDFDGDGDPDWIPSSITDMGSGEYASQGPGRAAYFRDMQVSTTSGLSYQLFHNAGGTRLTHTTDSACYSMSTPTTSATTNRFYYGGEGTETPQCVP